MQISGRRKALKFSDRSIAITSYRIFASTTKKEMPDADSIMSPSLNKIQSVLDGNHRSQSSAASSSSTPPPPALENGEERNSSTNGIIDHREENNIPTTTMLETCAFSEESSTTDENDHFKLEKPLFHEFYEMPADGSLIVRIRPKPLDATTVNVDFGTDHFDLSFRTSDPKFLATYEGTTEETRFRWTCNLSDTIRPDECKFRVQNLIEITLRKENPKKKWVSLLRDLEPPSKTSKKEEATSTTPTTPTIPSISVVPKTSTSTPLIHVYPNINRSEPIDNAVVSPQPGTSRIHHQPMAVVTPGFTGLRNFGNTCFMNAPLQALVNTREFRDYFLANHYTKDISFENPLGSKGRLAQAFGQFVREMWSGENRDFEPSLLKDLVGLKSLQFANFGQHDAQEFLSFLLDGLHEDMNRVGDKKPITPTVESNGRPDAIVADEAWRYHRMRNDSIVVDLFTGQLKSRLDCPVCEHTSITFDPFVYLPVPFPKSRRSLTFYFWGVDPYAKPVKYTLSFAQDESKVADVFERLCTMIDANPSQLRMIEAFHQRIFKRFNVEEKLTGIRPSDIIFVFQIHDQAEVGEEVVELTIIQRQLHPRMPPSSHCAGCNKETQDLKACTKCRTAAYCDVKCQKDDWKYHQIICQPPSPELVGEPFLISVPASQLTARRLVQLLEARAKHTVEVFEPSTTASENGDDDDGDGGGAVRLTNERIRVVFGEPNQESPRNRQPLFQLAVSNDNGEYVYKGMKETRFNLATSDDDGAAKDRPVALENNSCLALDWINKKKDKKSVHLSVNTKSQLEYDVDASASESQSSMDSDLLQLSDLFEHFTETETLSAEDAWFCGRCREHRQAKKTMQLWRLPSVLIVQLKRFVYTSNVFRNKIDKHVVYPIRDLDVRAYMPEGAAADENVKTLYDLYAVVNHTGTSFFGHYTGLARLPSLDDATKTDVEWRSFNDTHVTRVFGESQLIDPDAYFLFYKRRDDSPTKIFDRYREHPNEDESMDQTT